MSEKAIARLTLKVTVIEENGELFWETETHTTMLRQGDIRAYERALAQEGIMVLTDFRDREGAPSAAAKEAGQ